MTITDSPRTCAATEAHAEQAAGRAHLIDVRTPAEYRAVHAIGATLLPLEHFAPATVAASIPAGHTTYVLCKSGGRAAQAAKQLAAIGCTSVVVSGGTDAWVAAALPVERGRAVMSLERQVRIVAGLLVVIGVGLGYAVNTNWFALAGAIGAGLTIAGLTDTCMMGMLIARMPWNR
jgi:rhodanese-related sulfurtransferase